MTAWSLLLSIIILYLYFRQYTRSFFMAFCIVLIALLSFLSLAYPFGKFILGVRFSFHLNILLFYLIVKLSCLNFFVVFDAWKLSSKILPPYSQSQANAAKVSCLFFTLKHSLSAIIHLSTAPSLSFLILSFLSPLRPYNSLCLYAFLIIIFSAISVLFMGPALILFHE